MNINPVKGFYFVFIWYNYYGDNMKKYMYDYISNIDNLIKEKKVNKELLDTHMIKISFFEKEREIHLFVTSIYAFFFFGSLITSLFAPVFRFVALLLGCFLIPYILHYFKLENGVQYMYKQYDMIKEQL
jgi:hypothetical protein